MTHKKYWIKKKEIYSNHIRLELSNGVQFSNGNYCSIFCINELPYKNYQVGDVIEIDLTNARKVIHQSYHQELIRKVSGNYIEINDDYDLSQNEFSLGEEKKPKPSQSVSVQDEKTAHELKLALGNLRFMLEALEKFVVRAYGDSCPNFKSQLYEKKSEDDNYPLENSEDTFLTQLLIMKGVCKNEPEFFRNEIKKEYYKWIKLAEVDVNNCPEKLKHFLFEINEVLEDRGEKIVKEKEAKIRNIKFNPKDAIGLFSALQQPMNNSREEKKSYDGKSWKELGNENRFEVSDEQGEQGQGIFQKISQEVVSKQNEFSFYPHLKEQQKTQRLTYNWWQNYRGQVVSSSSQSVGSQPLTNYQIIQDVKDNRQDWRIDEVITEYDNWGNASKKELALIHKSAEIGYDGAVADECQPVYRAQQFSQEEITQISQILNISQVSAFQEVNKG